MIKFVIIILMVTLNLTSAEVKGVDPDTGYRIGKYRAPTPNELEGGVIVHTEDARKLIEEKSPVLIDVYGTGDVPFDPFDGTWPLVKDRQSIEGAFWIPEIGRGYLSPDYLNYYHHYMQKLTQGNKDQPVMFFCVSDCWMAWNVARRAILDGFTQIYWFPEGTDGWNEKGYSLEAIRPQPVPVE